MDDFVGLLVSPGFPDGASGTWQCRRPKRCRLDPWVREIPWRRAWQRIAVFLPGESTWIDNPGGLQSINSQRVRHNWVTLLLWCHVLEVVLYLCPNTWGLWVSLGCLLMLQWLWIIFQSGSKIRGLLAVWGYELFEGYEASEFFWVCVPWHKTTVSLGVYSYIWWFLCKGVMPLTNNWSVRIWSGLCFKLELSLPVGFHELCESVWNLFPI